MKNKRWAGRIYTHRAIQARIKDDIETMAYSVLNAGGRSLTINENGPYDPYIYCKDDTTKQWCPGVKKKMMGHIQPGGYVVYGDCETEIYLEVIKLFVTREIVFPFVK